MKDSIARKVGAPVGDDDGSVPWSLSLPSWLGTAGAVAAGLTLRKGIHHVLKNLGPTGSVQDRSSEYLTQAMYGPGDPAEALKKFKAVQSAQQWANFASVDGVPQFKIPKHPPMSALETVGDYVRKAVGETNIMKAAAVPSMLKEQMPVVFDSVKEIVNTYGPYAAAGALLNLPELAGLAGIKVLQLYGWLSQFE